MKEYKVKITDEALSDMNQIYDYINETLLSPENAISQYNRIADGILKLSSFPKRFHTLDFDPCRTKGLRRMIVDNYSVFYCLKDDNVIVTAVLYSASDIEERLKRKHSAGTLEILNQP
ncbi:MAG: type II toxin-antitoxin system RelE/ParE family toxin [Clostridia bacterium]|nr:type II toxin-antitoxin system RelE/ParE family toxin [Clostridia bacterium]